MPVDTKHPEYLAMRPQWEKMRDVVIGQRAVHAARERYLPRLDGEKDAKYLARLLRSTFFNATWRTIEGLAGMVFRVDPTVVVSPAVEPYLRDVTKSGVPLETFASSVLVEALEVGRVGILTDYPATATEGMTRAQAEQMNLRPQLALYPAESIINWSTSWVNNRDEKTLVVLEESVRVPGVDRYEVKTEKRWRVLELVEVEPTVWVYQVTVWRKNEAGLDEIDVPTFRPIMNGRPLSAIPFQFIGVKDLTTRVDEPPLSDLADVNLSHYRSTSDRKHGAHLTALPQPWANNVKPAFGPSGEVLAQEMTMGGGELWTFQADTTVGMLEYTGQGLNTLKEEIEREEGQMAVLGARMLEQQKKGVETAESAGIHRAGEQSALAAQAGVVSQGIAQALQIFQEWGGGGDAPVGFELNKNYFPAQLSPQHLTALVSAWQMGALTEQELFWNLQNGGAISEDVSYDDHKATLDAAGPQLTQGA